MLTKITVEAALNAELDEHLGYEKNQKDTSINYQNGYSSKTLKMANLNLIHQEIVMVTLSLSWSRKTKLALRRWMIRF